MNLNRLTERIWVYPYEEERDRPNLIYIQGDKWSLAVDAGHSADHTREFYKALEEAGLPLPELTVITHWHWDHTFGMHAAHGLTLANGRTNQYLLDFKARLEKEGPGFFLAMDESIRREYADGKPVTVVPADLSIGPKPITFKADSDSKVYDASALTKNSYTNTALAFDDRIGSVTVTGSQTVAGSSANVASDAKILKANGDSANDNYTISYTDGLLSVSRKAVTITADSDTKVYDGAALTKNSYTNTALATGDSIASVTVVPKEEEEEAADQEGVAGEGESVEEQSLQNEAESNE